MAEEPLTERVRPGPTRLRRAADRRRVVPALFVGVVSVLLCGLPTGRVAAHTEIDETIPADGAVVDQPVTEITVAFLEPVTLIGAGFEALTPQGEIVEPPTETDDDIVFRLLFDPPLADGDVGVRYEVRAEDGHVIDGSFSFRVDAPAPTTPPTSTVPAATTTTATPPGTDAPAATTPPPTTAPAEPADDTTPPTTVAESASTEDTEPADDDGSGGTTLIVVAALAVVGVVGGFLLMRSRTGGGSTDAT